jgi:hypothetical protein
MAARVAVLWITGLAGTLDARRRARCVKRCTGLLFAHGRRTVAGWLRACAAGRDHNRYYDLLGRAGRKAPVIAGALLCIHTDRLPSDGLGAPLIFAIDDSPAKRRGPHVEGAGTHDHPTPGPSPSTATSGSGGPAGSPPPLGEIARPILSHLYIPAKDGGWMASYYGLRFRTKLELAAASVEWMATRLGLESYSSGKGPR